jgi:hypothetical protein
MVIVVGLVYCHIADQPGPDWLACAAEGNKVMTTAADIATATLRSRMGHLLDRQFSW